MKEKTQETRKPMSLRLEISLWKKLTRIALEKDLYVRDIVSDLILKYVNKNEKEC